MLTDHTGDVSPGVLPSRKYNAGMKPSISTRNPAKSKFNPPMRPPTTDEARQILRLVIEKGITTVMTNYTYKWNREYRLHLSGGGIGDKLSQASSRLYMIDGIVSVLQSTLTKSGTRF